MTRVLLDTQVISYAMGGAGDARVEGQMITSVTAQEFLLAQDRRPGELTWLPVRDSSLYSHMYRTTRLQTKLSAARRRVYHDQLLIQWPPGDGFYEVGHASLTRMINDADESSVWVSSADLPRRQRVTIRDRFRFLMESRVTCLPLDRRSADNSIHLLDAFSQRYSLKAHWRNSINDILSLSIAEVTGYNLLTEDGLLATFARQQNNVSVAQSGKFVTLKMDEAEKQRRPARDRRGGRSNHYRRASGYLRSR